MKYLKNIVVAILLFCCESMHAQNGKLYPPYTKWYQDPLGLKPVELSSAAGFFWGSAAVAACLVFTKRNTSFRKKIFFYQEGGAYAGYKSPYTFTLQNNTGLLYKLREEMSVGMEMNIVHYANNTNNSWALGMRPFARWYFIKGRRANMFFEYGAGLSYNLNRFPLNVADYASDLLRTGTKFNFTTKYSAGTEIRISHHFFLQAGARHIHLSNGNIKGIDRNPSYDGNGLFAGLLYALNP